MVRRGCQTTGRPQKGVKVDGQESILWIDGAVDGPVGAKTQQQLVLEDPLEARVLRHLELDQPSAEEEEVRAAEELRRFVHEVVAALGGVDRVGADRHVVDRAFVHRGRLLERGAALSTP